MFEKKFFLCYALALYHSISGSHSSRLKAASQSDDGEVEGYAMPGWGKMRVERAKEVNRVVFGSKSKCDGVNGI